MLEDASEESEVDISHVASPLERDLACLKCGENLRGMAVEGECPKCALPVRKTLQFALKRVLCMACSAPNHPAQSHCRQCGASLNSAARNANYFRAEAMGVKPTSVKRRELPPRKVRKVAPAPVYVPIVFIWLLSLPGFILFSFKGWGVWQEGDGGFGTMFIGFGCLFLVLAASATRRALRRHALAAQVEAASDGSGDSPGGDPEFPSTRVSFGVDADLQAVRGGAIVVLHEWKDGTILAMLKEEVEDPTEPGTQPSPRTTRIAFRLGEPDDDGTFMHLTARYEFFQLQDFAPVDDDATLREKYQEMKDQPAQSAAE